MQRILYILFLTFVHIFAASAEKGSSKRGLAYGQWVNSSDLHIWNAAKSPLTWYYNVRSLPHYRSSSRQSRIRADGGFSGVLVQIDSKQGC